jgi:hypothetical protein
VVAPFTAHQHEEVEVINAPAMSSEEIGIETNAGSSLPAVLAPAGPPARRSVIAEMKYGASIQFRRSLTRVMEGMATAQDLGRGPQGSVGRVIP